MKSHIQANGEVTCAQNCARGPLGGGGGGGGLVGGGGRRKVARLFSTLDRLSPRAFARLLVIVVSLPLNPAQAPPESPPKL